MVSLLILYLGNSSSFLFTLIPNLRIYRSKSPSNSCYQWLNTKSYGHPHGIGFGGTPEGFRLFIPDTMEQCTAIGACPTFESGRFVEGDKFDIDVMEIWGVGGDAMVKKGLNSQKKQREIKAENIEKARKCDKAAFLESDFDKEMFLGNTFGHQKEAKNRDNA